MKTTSGNDVPGDFNVCIEIPAYSNAVKYEIDKETGALTVDRFMGTAMQYPVNYGYIPQTLAGDGDPVDVLVITPDPVLSGCLMRCRAIGILKMTDEAGEDSKVLAVPIAKLTRSYNRIKTFEDIAEDKLAEIVHFFKHYKDLEEDKWVDVGGWYGITEAEAEIMASFDRYLAMKHKPAKTGRPD